MPADLVVRRGRVADTPRDASARGNVLRASPREACLYWADAGAILVRDGREITVDARPGADARALRAYLLGPALAVALHQRGLMVLHASAVALDGGAVAFLGASGAGKSTTAAALHARGHPVIADDAVAIELAAAGPVTLPGAPPLRLLPDALTALGAAPADLPAAHPGDAKRTWAAGVHVAGPLPLRRCYVLADADRPVIEPLAGHPAVFAILQHSYVGPAIRLFASADHLARCARLAGAVPVRRLARPRALDRLAALAALVEVDAA